MRYFTVDDLPDLDECVMAALHLYKKEKPPKLVMPPFKRPLVVGSGNAAVTGRILFSQSDATFATESTYQEVLERSPSIDGAVIIAASGSKSSVGIAQFLAEKKIKTVLLTNTKDSEASVYTDEVMVFPKNREPYTYNISTYLGMILAKTGEDPAMIEDHLTNVVIPLLSQNLSYYDAFFFVVPAHVDAIRKMIRVKFAELFGSKVIARAYTPKEAWHSKTVVLSEKEFFIVFGSENAAFGTKNQLSIPLPENAGYGAMMAIAYFVIGRIQAAHPPYFKENIAEYVKKTSEHFGKEIPPIVE